MTSKTASSKIAKNLSTENNLDNSLYFKRAGSNIKSSQFFMNGQAITPAMDIPQIYNVAKEFFNNDMSRVKSLASFENEFFIFPMMINQTQEEYSSEIEWICSAGSRKDFNAYPILILCTDKTIEV
jgi:thiamine kinase-like enzyme